jgi:CRISPR-associated exonuclease Cas4
VKEKAIMYPEDDLLPISALQHLLYCERQCALIHVERAWAENALTVQGRNLHARADKGRGESRPGLRLGRGLPLRSVRLGLFGKADVVEFRPAHDDGRASIPFPVEYKRGRPKSHDADRVQLCAQGLCLEEMLGVAVPAGALFYGKTRRREDVSFDRALRELTEHAARRLHDLLASGRTPPAIYDEKKCDRCSLIGQCMPKSTGGSRSAAGYLTRSLAQAIAGPPSNTDD